MAVLQWTNGVVGNYDWSNVGNWIDIATSSPPSSLGAGDTYIVVVGSPFSDPINLNAANLGHLYIKTMGAAINVSLASYNAKSIIFDNKVNGGCPLNLTQAATVIAMDGTHSALAASPNYGMPIAINGSLSSTSGNAISTLKFTLGGSTTHYLPSSGQMDCVIEVLSGSQARLQINPNEPLIWANTYSPGGSAVPLSNPNRALNSLRLHQLLLPTNTTQPTAGGNENTNFQLDGTEYPQYTLEVGYGLASSLGIISTNNATLNLMGIKVVFHCTNSFTLPCDNLNIGSGMVQNTNPDSCTTVLLEDVELRLSSGTSCVVKSNLTFRAVSLTIGAGIFLQGIGDETHAAHIELVQKPTIRGTWNFEEQTDGFYKVMDKAPITSTIHATHCNAHILKEIRVDGYIKVKERATAPNSVAGFGMFWVDDAAPNTPMFTDDTGTSHNLLSGGGGGTTQNLFETVAVAGQSDVVADSATDTLTLVAGSNMTITTNASADSITFASAAGGATTFTALTDTPANYTASAGKVVAVNTSANALEFITAGIQGITIRDEGSPITGIVAPAGTIDFVGAGVTATSPSAGSVTVTIPGGGGGATGAPLFKHDENPTSSRFNPHRLLVNNDDIELGNAAGSGKDVSVFTPAVTQTGSAQKFQIVATGAAATNTGREFLFYGQHSASRQRFTGDEVVYEFDNSTLSVPHFFIYHMSQVLLPPTAPNFSFIVTHQLKILPMDTDGGYTPPNTVRVVDAGEFSLLNPSIDEENPVTHRLFLIVDSQWDGLMRQGNMQLGKNF